MYTMIAGTTPALSYARHFLHHADIPVTDACRWDVSHLLLDVPSFRSGSQDLDTILTSLPRDITIWGGNLNHPILDGYRCIDLLKDESYLTENAAITADCTLNLIQSMKNESWTGCKILIIGWGRIGKSLASKLGKLGCKITVSARSPSDRQNIMDLDFYAVDTSFMPDTLSGYSIIINTVPAMILPATCLTMCESCLKIDLASVRGIQGEDVVWARGLPGRYAPERSGKLIAQTFLRILKEERL